MIKLDPWSYEKKQKIPPEHFFFKSVFNIFKNSESYVMYWQP